LGINKKGEMKWQKIMEPVEFQNLPTKNIRVFDEGDEIVFRVNKNANLGLSSTGKTIINAKLDTKFAKIGDMLFSMCVMTPVK